MLELVGQVHQEAKHRVLIVASRDPGGPRTGRKAVISTIIRSLQALGYPLEVAVVARRTPEGLPAEQGVRVHRVPLAGPVQIAKNLVGFARGRTSLNECLFYSKRGAEQIREIAAAGGCTLVVADMIRTVPLARAAGLPLIVDLDDLLSERYQWLLRQGGDNHTILGYYAHQLPRFLSKPAGWVAARLLRHEARTLDRRELEVAREADAVSLVAAAEADRLERRSGVPVACLPMSIQVPETPADIRASDPRSIVFVGGLDYFPNEVAVRWFASEVASRLGSPPRFRLTVVGRAPEGVAAKLRSPSIRFVGYVDDVALELSCHRAFVAPMVEGTGVKTKVLEAMAVGLPVVTTTAGVRGLAMEEGVHCLIADTGEEFVEKLERLALDPELATRIGAAGRAYVRDHFGPEVIQERWAKVLASVDSRTGSSVSAGRLFSADDVGTPLGRAASSAFETGP
jgi:glycosyltransferase involved in cell wall biosynthesis